MFFRIGFGFQKIHPLEVCSRIVVVKTKPERQIPSKKQLKNISSGQFVETDQQNGPIFVLILEENLIFFGFFECPR